MQALEEAIQILRDCTRGKDERYIAVMTQLAIALSKRYDAAGNDDDLDEAISLLRESLTLYPSGHPQRNIALGTLGNDLCFRYTARRGPSDLVEATSLYREVIANSLPGSKDHTRYILNSCNTLVLLCETTGDLHPLEEAIGLCEDVLSLQRDNTAEQNLRNLLWYHMAELLLKRFELCHDTEDLHRAVQHYEHSLSNQPPNSVTRYPTLLGLATALRHVSSLAGPTSAIDAERSLTLLKELSKSLPIGHPDRALAEFELAQLYLVRNTPVHSTTIAMDHSIKAMSDGSYPALTRLRQGMMVLSTIEGDSAFELADYASDLLRAYQKVIALLPQVAFFGLNIESRLRSLEKSDVLAVRGASLAVSLEKPCLAVELLEQGRAVFWTQHLRLRSDLDHIPPSLAEELQKVSSMLDQGSLLTGGTIGGDVVQQEERVVKQRRLGERFQQLVLQVRAQPGLGRFLLPPAFQALAVAATHSPLVILLADQAICYALILSNMERACAIELQGLSLHALQKLARTMESILRQGRRGMRSRAVLRIERKKDSSTMERVLNILWATIGQTIVSTLQLKVQLVSLTIPLPTLTWIYLEI